MEKRIFLNLVILLIFVVSAPVVGDVYADSPPQAGTAWPQKGKLIASDSAADDAFGKSVSVSGDLANASSAAPSEAMSLPFCGQAVPAWGGLSAQTSAITSFQIGSGWYGGYDGLIDEFRIYDYALSQPEIVHIATNETGIFDLPLMSPADLFTNNQIDFRDFAILANSWLDEQLWP